MQSAFKITTKVLPGNKIEVELPPGSENKEVDVIIVLPEEPPAKPCNVLEIIEEARQHHGNRTAEDIDRQLRIERDSWDS